MLTVLHDGTGVECPVCGIRGELSVVDGKIKVVFSEKEQKRSRLFYAGKLEHSTEIKTQAAPPGVFPIRLSFLNLTKITLQNGNPDNAAEPVPGLGRGRALFLILGNNFFVKLSKPPLAECHYAAGKDHGNDSTNADA